MIVVLCGGFGAARFVEALASLDGELCCVVNVADDFDHLGLRVCPDLDSVLYALAGVFDEERGWGPLGDSLATNAALDRYGDSWFQLGDKDLALSLKRTALLREGRRLSEVTSYLAGAWSVTASIVPATDDPVGTRVRTADGWREFAGLRGPWRWPVGGPRGDLRRRRTTRRRRQGWSRRSGAPICSSSPRATR